MGYAWGLLQKLYDNFTGPLLYNEKNVYKNTQTGMHLKLKFPQQAPELNFKNPGMLFGILKRNLELRFRCGGGRCSQRSRNKRARCPKNRLNASL